MTNWQYPLVVVNFPKFAGGKFLINCLSLSQHTVPQHAESALLLIANPRNIALRKQVVFGSLPNADDMVHWDNYELGCQQLYGSEVDYWRRGIRMESTSDVVAPLTCSDLTGFMVSHNLDEVRQLQRVWPNLIMIRLFNYEHWQNLSLNLKGGTPGLSKYNGNECEEQYDEIAGPDWPTWQQFAEFSYDTRKLHPRYARYVKEIEQFYTYGSFTAPCFEFDVSSYTDWNRFETQCRELYTWLNFKDFNPKLIKELWQSYVSLHIDLANENT